MMQKTNLISIGLLLLLPLISNAASLAEIKKSSVVQVGFVDLLINQDEGRTYLRIHNFDEEFVYQTSLPAGLGSNDIGLDRGQLSNTRLAVFERAGNKVFLKQKPTKFRAITNNTEEAAAVEQAFASSILWGFEVEDSGPDWAVVDASDFILQDIHGVGRRLAELKQGEGYKVDASRSALDAKFSKGFPDNTELQASITLTGDKPGNYLQDTAPDPRAITLKMRHSFVRLPDDKYKPRRYHPKSGYWSVGYRDYAQPINQDIRQRFIGRHRLQKAQPDAPRSAAVEPIIYYLDPGAPEPVRSALIDGAQWWNQAFEALGYENAFQVKILPQDADPMDVRYNVIQWVHRSTRGWSYGYGIADPRTGEIIKGHVTLGSLRVRQDYLIAQGLMAPFSQGKSIEDGSTDQALMDLALARIRQLAAHEVGHTLGINHNFAASSYGRESVMDYPHPQFSLDGETISAPKAYGVGLGKWDFATVAYGYSELKGDEQTALAKMIAENDANGLLYISDPDARHPGSPHPTASLWDNGSDAVAELEAMAEIRRVAIDKFGADSLQSGRSWADLEEIFVPVYFFHRYQIAAAAKWLGGVDYDYSIKNGTDTVSLQIPVSASEQQRALSAMLSTLSPEFLAVDDGLIKTILPKEVETQRNRESVHGLTGVTFDPLSLAAASAQHTLGLILVPERLARIEQQNALDPQSPSLSDITQQLHEQVVDRDYQDRDLLLQQTVIDLIYSNYLNLLANEKTTVSARAAALNALEYARSYHRRKSSAKGGKGAFHALQAKRLEDISMEIDDQLLELPKMPPGSPI